MQEYKFFFGAFEIGGLTRTKQKLSQYVIALAIIASIMFILLAYVFI
jgi:hypothetical protein